MTCGSCIGRQCGQHAQSSIHTLVAADRHARTARGQFPLKRFSRMLALWCEYKELAVSVKAVLRGGFFMGVDHAVRRPVLTSYYWNYYHRA